MIETVTNATRTNVKSGSASVPARSNYVASAKTEFIDNVLEEGKRSDHVSISDLEFVDQRVAELLENGK